MSQPMPIGLVREVDSYVRSELDDAKKFDNREPLDESGVWSLHRLVERAYAQGWQEGAEAESERARARASRAEL